MGGDRCSVILVAAVKDHTVFADHTVNGQVQAGLADAEGGSQIDLVNISGTIAVCINFGKILVKADRIFTTVGVGFRDSFTE